MVSATKCKEYHMLRGCRDEWAKHKDLDSYEAKWLYVDALLKVWSVSELGHTRNTIKFPSGTAEVF